MPDPEETEVLYLVSGICKEVRLVSDLELEEVEL